MGVVWQEAPDLHPGTLSLYERILEEWKGTPYMPGVCGKQQGVDCARWCCAVLAEMEGLRVSIRAMPQDTAFHNPAESFQAVRQMMELFWPVDNVTDSRIIRPGYMVVEGPIDGGEAHALLVGPLPNLLWHSTTSNSVGATPALLPEGHEIKHILSIRDRNKRWLR